jgi:gamma-glutamylcyclotransferase (GGCT)/AIG2-like uncharacterized protein YtfP
MKGTAMYEPRYAADISALYFTHGPAVEDIFTRGFRVFVCGALQNPSKMRDVTGQPPAFAPASVAGFKRTTEILDGAEVPFMTPDGKDPTRILTGVVWLNLDQAALDRIESLELGGGYRRRIEITAHVGEMNLTAYTYIRE